MAEGPLHHHPDARRWDQRYREANDRGTACRLLREYTHLLPDAGRALDLACGLGGNALLLAQQGLEVEAWDISTVALGSLAERARQQQLDILCRQYDLSRHRPDAHSFDVIVVSYYLDRTLLPHLVSALRPSGLLYYQTFSRMRVDDSGPSNPDFRLADNELLHYFRELHLRFYREEGLCGKHDQGLRNEVMFIGQKVNSLSNS